MTTPMSSVQEAASRVLDAVVDHGSIMLDVSFEECTQGAFDHLIEAINDEARRQAVGIVIDTREENRLCLSLHHP